MTEAPQLTEPEQLEAALDPTQKRILNTALEYVAGGLDGLIASQPRYHSSKEVRIRDIASSYNEPVLRQFVNREADQLFFRSALKIIEDKLSPEENHFKESQHGNSQVLYYQTTQPHTYLLVSYPTDYDKRGELIVSPIPNAMRIVKYRSETDPLMNHF